MRPDACPICFGTHLTPDYRAQWQEVVVHYQRCHRCGVRFAFPPREAAALLATYDDSDYWDSSGANAFMYQDYLNQKEALCADVRLKWHTLCRHLRRTPTQEMKVLDVGCGCGFSLLPLVEAGVDATGVEVSRPMSDYARRALGVSCVTALIEEYQSEPCYDLIVSWGTALNFHDPVGAYGAMGRLLRPDGVLVLDLFDISSPFAFLTAGKRRKGVHIAFCHTVRSMEILLRRVGFTKIEARGYIPRFSLSFIGTQLDSRLLRWLLRWPPLQKLVIPTPVPGTKLIYASGFSPPQGGAPPAGP